MRDWLSSSASECSRQSLLEEFIRGVSDIIREEIGNFAVSLRSASIVSITAITGYGPSPAANSDSSLVAVGSGFSESPKSRHLLSGCSASGSVSNSDEEDTP